MWRAGNTGPASAIPSPIPRLFYNVWAYLSEGWTIDARLAFTLEKVRSGSGTEIPCAFGTSGSMRIAAFELRSQACRFETPRVWRLLRAISVNSLRQEFE
jgi:hypothetical protein